MINDLHKQGIHLITIIDPGTRVDENYFVYQQGIGHDYFCRYMSGEIFTGSVWPGECVFPDFSRASVRKWWGNNYQGLLEQFYGHTHEIQREFRQRADLNLGSLLPFDSIFAGYDPTATSDPIYFHDGERGAFVALDQAAYDGIRSGQLRL